MTTVINVFYFVLAIFIISKSEDLRLHWDIIKHTSI